jgi:hypothetical protein
MAQNSVAPSLACATGCPTVTLLELPTPVTGLVLRELAGADADHYYAALDRNRNHFRRFGDYADEIAATRTWVVRYFADPDAIGPAGDALGASGIFAGVTRGKNKSVAVLRRLGFVRVAEFGTYDRFHLPLASASPPDGL